MTKHDALKCIKIITTEMGYKAYDKLLSIVPKNSRHTNNIIRKKDFLKKFGHCTRSMRRPRKGDPKPGNSYLLSDLHRIIDGEITTI